MRVDSSGTNLRRRLDFLGIDPTDHDRLRPLADWLEGAGASFLDPFFDHLLRFDELRPLFPDESKRRRARSALHRALLQVLRGPVNASLESSWRRIGQTHEELGLSLDWYLGAFALLGNMLIPVLARLSGEDPAAFSPALESLLKVMNLDLQAGVDFYLNQYHQRVRAKEEESRLKTLFLWFISREIGKPSARLKELIRTLGEETDPWKIWERMPELVDSVHEMDRLVRDLIDTAAIESGAIPLRPEPVDLTALIRDRLAKRLRRLRGFRFLPELPAGPQIFLGDKKRLTSLVDDLLDAAVQLSPGGGTILVRLARENRGISLSTQNRSGGLPVHRLDSILERVRGGEEDGEVLEGNGLSLYRSACTAESLGGRMELTALPKGGTAFTVIFPLPDKDEPKT